MVMGSGLEALQQRVCSHWSYRPWIRANVCDGDETSSNFAQLNELREGFARKKLPARACGPGTATGSENHYIRKYSNRIFATSIATAVGICALITAYLSGSSSNAAGIRL